MKTKWNLKKVKVNSYKSNRRSILGYVVAIANENGGMLIFGVKDAHPHEIVGSKLFEGEEGNLNKRYMRISACV